MSQRYDATCPSEFYRGYATVLVQVKDALPKIAGLMALRQLVDQMDATIRSLPGDERRSGASFALTNVASYVQSGSQQQVAATLSAEVVCIANCFYRNRTLGL